VAEILINDEVIQEIDLMIFDKDGTLIDVHQYWSAMVGYRSDLICDRLGLNKNHRDGLKHSMGVDLGSMKLKPGGPVGLKKRDIVMMAAVDYLSAHGFNNQVELCREVFDQVDRLSLGRLNEIIKPIKGLYDLFDALEKAPCKVAIATTDLTERAWLAMEHLGLGKRIHLIVGADKVSKAKPHPETIELILNELQISPQRAVMVGDAKTDVTMGINARVRASIGVCSGLTINDELRSITPYVIPDISAFKILP
jgi:HAD superfamily hydrolase (TIGR01549 family)